MWQVELSRAIQHRPLTDCKWRLIRSVYSAQAVGLLIQYKCLHNVTVLGRLPKLLSLVGDAT